MTNKKVYISQKDNYAGAFGLVYRSSANFYFRQSNTFKTTISFMDYWRIKRGISVMVVASTRSMDGKLLMREQLTFKNGSIIIFSLFPLSLKSLPQRKEPLVAEGIERCVP